MSNKRLRSKSGGGSKPQQGITKETPISLDSVRQFPVQYGELALKSVPMFLVDAFNLIRLNGLHSEGLFRREGNSNRMKLLWYPMHGYTGIPECCTVYDVCGLVKKFLRVIQPPLLADLESQFLRFFLTITHPTTQLQSLLELCHVLPPAHRDTLVHLCRQMKIITEHSEWNKMDSGALATCLVGSVFRDQNPPSTPVGGTQEDIVNAAKSHVEDKAALLQLLIGNADRIGVLSRMEKVMSPNMYSDLLPEDDPTTPIHKRLYGRRLGPDHSPSRRQTAYKKKSEQASARRSPRKLEPAAVRPRSKSSVGRILTAMGKKLGRDRNSSHKKPKEEERERSPEESSWKSPGSVPKLDFDYESPREAPELEEKPPTELKQNTSASSSCGSISTPVAWDMAEQRGQMARQSRMTLRQRRKTDPLIQSGAVKTRNRSEGSVASPKESPKKRPKSSPPSQEAKEPATPEKTPEVPEGAKDPPEEPVFKTPAIPLMKLRKKAVSSKKSAPEPEIADVHLELEAEEDDEVFEESPHGKEAILNAGETLRGHQFDVGPRPSIAYINNNRCGAVHAMVNQWNETVRRRSAEAVAPIPVQKKPKTPPPKPAPRRKTAGGSEVRSLRKRQLKRLDAVGSPKSPLDSQRKKIKKKYPKSPMNPIPRNLRRSLDKGQLF